MLGYLVLVVLVVTLAPFEFRVRDGVHLTYWTSDSRWHGVFDPIANVALFAPLGFVYALTRATVAPDARGTLARAWGGGVLLSTCVETVQLFEPARYASPTDVATNALGALFGAWLHGRLARRLRADTLLAGGLALELPVMGLVYVALPLLMLASLTADGGPRDGVAFSPRPAGIVALALFGAMLLGTVQRRRGREAGRQSDLRRALGAGGAAGLWFAIGGLPALATAPRAFGVGLAAAVVAAAVVSTSVMARPRDERRFESEAIGRAAPFLALFLALFPFGHDVAATELTDGHLLRALEGLCGFAVLGYLLGEAWGRRELRYRHSVRRVACAAGAAAVSQALLAHGADVDADTALAEVGVRTLCAAYGGWIYHLQRAHVRALVEARRVHGTARRRAPAPDWTTRGAAARDLEVLRPAG
ncbi:hypothetical protein tb265_22820 [Gemmatimonadetes bacterium T265]|nr:hypothetical protein tb265_22820 [Gemmatimonadetes bacterium T265]